MPTIFVLDDSGINPSSLSARLRRAGYHVLSMSDEREALDALHCMRADMLIIDCPCVPAGGAALLTAIRDLESYSDMPVLLVGLGAADGQRLGGDGDSAAAGVLPRNVPRDVLLDRVRSYVDPLQVPFN